MSGSPQTPSPVNITRLLAEAASASGVLWIEAPPALDPPARSRAYAVWFAWHDDEDPRGAGPAAYVVSGDGEQHLPDLPDDVSLILRSKDTGGRLLRINAHVRTLEPGSAEWEAAAAVLRAARLNATGDVIGRWRESATVRVLTPHGRPEEAPGSYADDAGVRDVTPAPGTTATWRPWHWRGRRRR